MAKYFVNDECIGCGLCVETAPEVFEMQGDMAVAISDDGENAEEALENCPVSAIEKN
jgi:ferredoxin